MINDSDEAFSDFLDINPLGKIPALNRDDGFVLTECIAIALYRK